MLAISVVGVSKSYGARPVLTDVSVDIGSTSRMGVVGANGTGKSTLLRILSGEAPDSGRVIVAPRRVIRLLPQELAAGEGTTWDWALEGVADVLALRARWTALADAITASPGDPTLLDEYGAVQEALERADGFQIEAVVRETLTGLGVPPETWDQPVTSLSGGERSRLNLARTLLGHPDVLLLDEPTNHLDIGAIEWLEAFLVRFRGAVVAASHDRRFLDAFAERIVELDTDTTHVYAGNYSAYAAAKTREREAQAAAFAQHRQEVERLREFVRSRLQRAARIQRGPKRGRDYYGRVAKKVAKTAQGARRRLARLEAAAQEAPRVRDSLRFSVESTDRPGDALAHLRSVTLRYGEKLVLAGVDVTLLRGDRIGLVGPNGSGKTSLLRLLAQTIRPSAGEVWIGSGVRTAYLTQDAPPADPARRVIDVALQSGLSPSEARAVLAGLLFRGDRVSQPVATLSGGERTRLALFELIARQVNLLLLDEPTNHLDLPARERLEEVLDAYEGTLVIASHDRFLLDRLCHATWAIEAHTVRERPATSPPGS